MVVNKDMEQTDKSIKTKKMYINFHVDGETSVMFLALKKHYNLKYNMEIFRLIVKKVYDELFKKDNNT